MPDVTRALAPLDDDAEAMGNNLVEFLTNEVKHGRLPENLLPLQSGVGNVANAVIHGLVESQFKNLSVYTEVIQDGMFELIDKDKIDMISGTSLSPSPEAERSTTTSKNTTRRSFCVRRKSPTTVKLFVVSALSA